MTDRIYYLDPQNREFDATIAHVDRRDSRNLVRLDRTSFYPTSGGQPFDTGMLGDARVVEVVENDDGDVVHVVEVGATGAPKVGERVHGAIDWPRRFDHMQQHTGQHVLSGAFDRLFGATTVAFHLGAEASTIDLARELTPKEIAAAEDDANTIVWEDRPVTIRFVSAEEGARLPLRKEPVREGTLRLIEVEGFDLSACGGTHVPRTGAIGVIAISSWERFKGGQRVEFLCGRRALLWFRSLRDTMAANIRLLSVSPGELPASIERLQAEAKEQRRAIVRLQAGLARYRAEELAAGAERTPVGHLVLQALDPLEVDANGLKTIASAITARPGFIVVLVSASTPALAVIARSTDVATQSNETLAALTAKFGGRGGGKPDLAQGGGLNASPREILEEARLRIAATPRSASAM
jgi:alanyl-tRNA synthetase